MAERTVLVVEHEAGAPGGWLAEHLEAAGCRLEVRRPYAGDAVEPLVEGGLLPHGIVVLGGAMAAWDDAVAPWLPAVRALVRAAEHRAVPTLGVCLGHQLSAMALGGVAARNPAGSTVAVLPIGWVDAAADDPLFAQVRGTAALGVHWNNDVVTALPPEGQVLASSPDGAVQAARFGRSVWGVQFHPEAGPEILEGWVEEYGATHSDAGFDLETYLADARAHRGALEQGCSRLARSFAALVRER